MRIKSFLKKAVALFLGVFPTSNVIVFESAPIYADNTRAVFDEMVRRHMHKKYRFVWLHDPRTVPPQGVQHVRFEKMSDGTLTTKLRNLYYFYFAKAFISCNAVLPARRKGQYAICLMHGAPLKKVRSHYTLPQGLDDIVSFSEYLMPYEAMNTGSDINKMRLLGFPRNDILLKTKLDTHALFNNTEFDKLIYWMPTYRQHGKVGVSYSNIAMPIIYNEEIAEQINKQAKKNRVLVVIKPHFAQDVSRIKIMNLSNIRFIDDDFLSEHGIINYELLGKADALLTDYSSVYYDYLLTDRPIGLCWDDYEVFEEREGFIVDMDTVLAGGEKIYTTDDLCGFIARIAAGKDVLCVERRKVTDLIHHYKDENSTKRVVDLIEKKLS